MIHLPDEVQLSFYQCSIISCGFNSSLQLCKLWKGLDTQSDLFPSYIWIEARPSALSCQFHVKLFCVVECSRDLMLPSLSQSCSTSSSVSERRGGITRQRWHSFPCDGQKEVENKQGSRRGKNARCALGWDLGFSVMLTLNVYGDSRDSLCYDHGSVTGI